MMDLTLPTVRHSGQRLLELAEAMEDQAAAERLPALLERTDSGEFCVVVVGEIKKGKSSFINALLGYPDLLPALSDVATSTVFQVSYGETLSYRVHFQADSSNPTAEPRVIRADEVADYGTEDGNPNNARGVDYIAVELPHPLLQQGLRLVDTPGLGGLFKSHAEILWRYAPEADAVFFVLDSVEAVASRPEMEALARLRRMTPLLFFVQTKTDLASQEQWHAWQQRNCTILADTLAVQPETLRYFPISAKLKQAADRRQDPELLRDSGYEALLAFLTDDLMALKETYLAGQSFAALAAEAGALNQRGEQHLKALTAKTQDELTALDQAAVDARNAFRQWKDAKYRELKGEFGIKAKEQKRDAENELQNRLDPGATGPIVGSLMHELRTSTATAEQLAQALDDLRSEVIDRCAHEMLDIHDSYQQRMRTLIAATTERMGVSLPRPLEHHTADLKVERATVVVEDSLHWWHDRMLPQFRSAATTSAIASYALVGINIAFVPITWPVAAAVMISSMAAGILFSSQAIKNKQREKVLGNLEKALTANVKVAQRQATQQFRSLADRFEYAASEAFDQVIQQRTNDLDQQIEQIDLARRQTTAEKSVLSERVKGHLSQLATLIQELDQAQREARRRLEASSPPVGTD